MRANYIGLVKTTLHFRLQLSKKFLPDVEFSHPVDEDRSNEVDHLRKYKFVDDTGKAHVNLVRHLVEMTVKAQEVDSGLLKVSKSTLQKQIHSVTQGMRDFMDSPTSMEDTRAFHQVRKLDCLPAGDSPVVSQTRITESLEVPSQTFSHTLSKIRLKKHGLNTCR